MDQHIRLVVALWLFLMALAGGFTGWILNDAFNEIRTPTVQEES